MKRSSFVCVVPLARMAEFDAWYGNRPEGAQHVSPATQQAGCPGNRERHDRRCHVWLGCITHARGCAALGYGWQNQRKALKGRNKWRTRQTSIRKPEQFATRTNAAQRGNASSITRRCASENRRSGPWRLLRPFRASAIDCIANPGWRDRSQDSRSLPLG